MIIRGWNCHYKTGRLWLWLDHFEVAEDQVPIAVHIFSFFVSTAREEDLEHSIVRSQGHHSRCWHKSSKQENETCTSIKIPNLRWGPKETPAHVSQWNKRNKEGKKSTTRMAIIKPCQQMTTAVINPFYTDNYLYSVLWCHLYDHIIELSLFVFLGLLAWLKWNIHISGLIKDCWSMFCESLVTNTQWAILTIFGS